MDNNHFHNDTNNDFRKLITFFEDFPGVGARQARRFALFLMTKQKEYINDFTQTLISSKQDARACSSCMRYHFGANFICSICSDESRDHGMLLIVEKDQDIDAFEHAHVYHGTYFVLGKLISLISKDEIKLTRLMKLLEKIEQQESTGTPISEIVLAFPSTPNGNFTDGYVRGEITKKFPTITIKSLGRGFATGSDPEYADPDTLLFALKNRA